jgi:alkanesulfonate monooxygenase SsuD/methylene tetrahydromethanopterin reductase-like flavin-dependent oxidoreductase (luciferase family)
LLGIGSGWLAEEFATLGVPFEQRGARTDEAIRAIRSLWKPQPEPFHGKFFAWDAVESNPKPIQQPGVPILVGGHSEAAARRAARLGDGFFPAQGDFETLPRLFAVLRGECERLGRDPKTVELTCGAFSLDRDTVARYAELGISRLVIPPPAFDADSLVPALERFAREVIEPCRNL